jgi:nucleoside-diphosphate-sugar epimerase
MNILVTGNLGYIGSVLTPMLRDRNYSIVGLDIGYFRDCKLFDFNEDFSQIIKDIRDITPSDLTNIDTVIHLAGLSNDPVGEINSDVTFSINFDSTVNLVKLAKENGVSRFIFASTQSIYGISNSNIELDEYESVKNPITAYAKSKWLAEQEIFKQKSDKFCVVSLRFSTVFGISPRLRTDIVFNNLMVNGFLYNEIKIYSDGTPWRPLVHVNDACNAIVACIDAPDQLINGRIFNVGYREGNYTVLELAKQVQRLIHGSKIFIVDEKIKDNRTYKVSFKRIHTELYQYFNTQYSITKGAEDLLNFLIRNKFSNDDLLGNKCIRLKQLNFLRSQGIIDGELRFT